MGPKNKGNCSLDKCHLLKMVKETKTEIWVQLFQLRFSPVECGPRYLSLKLVTFGLVICWHKVCLKMKTTLKMKTSSRMKTTLNHGSRIIYHESCISSIMYPVLCSCIMHHEKWKILLDKVVIYFHICMWYVVTCIL